jgi:aminopeptidase N
MLCYNYALKLVNNSIILALGLLIFVSCKSTEASLLEPQQLEVYDLSDLNVQSPWAGYQASETKSFDISHVDISLVVDWSTPKIKGTATLLMAPHFYTQETLVLDAQRMTIDRVLIDGEPWDLYAYDGRYITINLPREYERAERVEVQVYYQVNRFSKPAHDTGGIFLVDYRTGRPKQIWTLGETEFTSTWYPTIDHPNQRYTQQVTVVVDDSLTTLSNGELISQKYLPNQKREDVWKLNKPHAPYLSMLAIGSFVAYHLDHPDLDLLVFLETDADSLAVGAFARTGEMIEFYEKKLGVDFPWPAYNQIVVRDFVSGAMENTGAVVFMEDLMQTANAELINQDDIISHELAHHWFGNLVTCESWSNISLNESFATYAEHLWMEHKYGIDSAEFIGFTVLNDYLMESEDKRVEVIRNFYDDPDEDVFDNHSYSKGSRILHMLRLYLGDEAFFTSVKNYLTKHSYQSVELDDLRLSFEEISGMDLTWFFTQWFVNPGHPELDVIHRVESDTLFLEVSQVQDLEEYPLFFLPLNVDVKWLGEETLSYPLTVQNQRHVFRIPALGRSLEYVVFDGDYQLVGTIYHSKTKKELFSQAQQGLGVMARYEGYVKLLDLELETNEINQLIGHMIEEPALIIKSLLIDRLGQYDTKTLVSFKDQLLDLSRHRNLHVRASALMVLADHFDSEVDWMGQLSDPVEIVQGLALEYLLNNQSLSTGIKDSLLSEYQSSRDLNILLPLAYYVNTTKQNSFEIWYQNKISEALSADQFYLLSAYTQYLMSISTDEVVSAAEFLTVYAMHHQSVDARLIAFEGLLILPQTQLVGQLIAEVMDYEEDEQLQLIHQKITKK